jgi:hypothetical protein
MGWWNTTSRVASAPKATTSQDLTTLGQAPIFNDNRVQAAATAR